MTDLEISKALALAIGYQLNHIRVWGAGSPNFNNGQGKVQVFRHDSVYSVERTDFNHLWHSFDYRDWNAIAPIAERYDCFPYKDNTVWTGMRCGPQAETPQKAIAMAVIGAKK